MIVFQVKGRSHRLGTLKGKEKDVIKFFSTYSIGLHRIQNFWIRPDPDPHRIQRCWIRPDAEPDRILTLWIRPDPDPAGCDTRPIPNALDPAGSGSSMILALPYLTYLKFLYLLVACQLSLLKKTVF